MGIFRDNVTRVTHGDQQITHTTHEHRAPTDDSVKLLREMEEESFKSIIAKIKLKNNKIDGALVIIENPRSFNFTYLIRYVFNGENKEVEFDVDSDYGHGLKPRERHDKLMNQVHTALSMSIAHEMLYGMWEGLNRGDREAMNRSLGLR